MNVGEPVVLRVVPQSHHLHEGYPFGEFAPSLPIPQPGDVGEVSYVTPDPDFGCVKFPSGAVLSCVTFSTDCYEFFVIIPLTHTSIYDQWVVTGRFCKVSGYN